jgi:glycosyltransferase involved in cell wall biosynthesis
VVHPVDKPEFRVPERAEDEKPSIGFFSRLSLANGLDRMIGLFLLMKKDMPDLQLHLCGGYTASDKAFIRREMARVHKAGHGKSLHLHNSFTGSEKENFFRSIDLLSVPVRKPDAWGQYLIESIGAGVPVVQPPTGASPEIIEMTGGGALSDQDTEASLAGTMIRLLNDRPSRMVMRNAGIASLDGELSPERMKERIRTLYRSVTGE